MSQGNGALQTALQEMDNRYNKTIGVASSNLCTHCGWCVDQCHYYLATKDPTISPVAKAERVRRVYKRHHDWMSRVLPRWTGARELTEAELDDWVEVAYRNCTLCDRCMTNCPLAVDTAQILLAARGVLLAAGKAPEMLVQLADAALAREENLEFFKEFYLEQLKDLEVEVQDRLGSDKARIPTEVEGAKILYVPLSGAHTITPPATVFNAVGESWTISMFEASNYATYIGDVPKAKRIAERILREAERLKVEEIVIAECGHAYHALRWEAPKWFGGPLPFRVRSILEVLDGYVSAGRLRLNRANNPEPVTLHDSCNLGRKGGLFEEPRRVVQAAVEDFREMTPNRERSFCCGAGAGLVAMPEWEDIRLKAGQPKAEQVHATGASVVIASCDNCRHQLTELNEHYGLNVQVIGLAELVVQALVPGSSS
ncbi:MAG: (Fe-S)-binding protein [Planctomycetaceae bacterium]|nr:MAG: (Fe-S)-binding protein [Planctomycetaceae bacterium]